MTNLLEYSHRQYLKQLKNQKAENYFLCLRRQELSQQYNQLNLYVVRILYRQKKKQRQIIRIDNKLRLELD